MASRLVNAFTFQCGGLMESEGTAGGGTETFVSREVGDDATSHAVVIRVFEDGTQEVDCPELTDTLIRAQVDEARGLCLGRCRAVYREGRGGNVKRSGANFPCPYYHR